MTVPHSHADAPVQGAVLRRGTALLSEMIRTNPWPFTGALAGAVVFALASVGGAIVLGRVTDDLIVGRGDSAAVTVGAALGAAGAIIGMSATRAAGVVARRYLGIMATRRMQMEWFDRLSDHYLDQPLRFFQTQPTGKLLAHADNDAERSAFVMQPLPLSMGAAVLIVVASISLAVLDPLLLLIGLLLFPTLMLMNHLYTARVEGPSSRAQAQVGAVSAVAHESFEGALVVKLLGIEGRESSRMRVAAGALRAERLLIGRLRATFEPGIEALPTLGTVALLAVGASRVNAGAITTGDLVQAMTLFGILSFPMRIVGLLLEELPRSVVSRDRILAVLGSDHADAVVVDGDEQQRRPLPAGPLPLTVDRVSFSYGGTTVVEGLSFTVEPGQVVAVVGATGSGKSTLCTILTGLARPTAGEVRLGGVPLRHAHPAELRQAVSLVFQETFLFADTVRENLTLGEPVDEGTMRWAMRIAQATFVEHLAEGLDTVVGERGVTLSGGQRQRVALARAMLRRPRLLLLDDATSAIDPVVEQRILDGLREELETTTLVIAHRVATIRLADRVLFMEGGRIVADGTHEELLAATPAYRALVRAYEQASSEADEEVVT